MRFSNSACHTKIKIASKFDLNVQYTDIGLPIRIQSQKRGC
jgi:hypothetical protein